MSETKKRKADICWDLMIELRKELVESQKIRAQVIGFKITLVSTGVGIIVANLDKVPPVTLVIPAFAAIFLDILIENYTLGVRRIGVYCREYLEPEIRNSTDPPLNFPLWEEFMIRPETRRPFSMVGNLGITGLAVVAAIVSLFVPFRWYISLPILIGLLSLFSLSIEIYRRIGRIQVSGLKGVMMFERNSSGQMRS